MRKIYIYGEIGWDITPENILEQLQGIEPGKDITVIINSWGGDVFDGIAIYNTLLEYNTTVLIYGVAASIASVIACAGKDVRIAETGMIMIHNPWTYMAGESSDLAHEADVLAKAKTAIIQAYKRRTGKSEEEISVLMDDETWMTAKEAKEMGFVDKIVDPGSADIVAMYKIAAHVRNLKYSRINKVEIGANMNLRNLIIKLMQIPSDSTDEGIISALKARFSRAEKVQSLEQENTDLKNQVAILSSQIQDRDDADQTARATSLVENAIKDGKVAPAQKDFAMKLALADPDSYEEFIDQAKVLIPGGEDGPTDTPVGTGDPLYNHYQNQAN